MKNTTKLGVFGATALVLVVGLAAVLAALDSPVGETPTTSTSIPPTTTTGGDSSPSLEDGEWFGFVTVDTGGDIPLLVIDPAEMLTGDAAHDAAVDAGVIAEDEDLPNDYFILNTDEEFLVMPMAPDGTISVVSALDAGNQGVIDIELLAALMDGTYSGDPVYGIAPGSPVPFQVKVVDGAVVNASQVYVP